MNLAEIGVLIGGLGLIVFIIYYFFGPKGEGKKASRVGKQQVVEIVVDGAYIPNEITLKAGVPAVVVFDRRDKGDCTEWVIFDPQMSVKEKKQIKKKLLEGKKTQVKFTPSKPGKYEFVCGMGMVKGRVIVK